MKANQNWQNWRHVTKLDPDKENSMQLIEQVCSSGTDAVIIGGTQGITAAKVQDLLNKVKYIAGTSLPVSIEVSHPEAVLGGVDKYFIPVVLNTRDLEWLIGAHYKMFLKMGRLLDATSIEQLLVPEGYIILNHACAAAVKTEANAQLNLEEILSFARVAKLILKLPIIYLEYSGSLGQPGVVKEIKKFLKDTKLFYGGGIQTPEDAGLFANYADTVIVGNVVYTKPEILSEIVTAVKTSSLENFYA